LNANDGGIGVSADSVDNWTKPTLGMNTSQFYGVDKKPGASAYIGGMQDNGTWRSPEDADASSLWVFQIGGDGYETSWHFNDPSKIIGGSQYNGLRRSVDGGLSWSSATSGLGDTGSGSAPFITKIGKSNMEPDLLFAVGASGVWRSTNFGGTWSLSSITGTNWGGVSSFIDVKISRANPNIVWAGSRMDPSGKINVSTDQGITFNPTPVYSLVSMGGISGLATHPQQDSTAYVLFSFAHKPKVLRTQDLGQTWEDISGFGTDTVSSNGFPDVAVYDVLVFPNTPDTIWAGTEIGLFESTDNGASWHIANNGLPAVPIWAMTHVEEEVVLATHGRGIWSVTIPGLSSGQTFSPLLEELYQGPNGFLSIGIGLRSVYDSTNVFIDGGQAVHMGPNAVPQDTLLEYVVTQSGNVSVSVTAYKDGVHYDAISKNIDVLLFSQPQTTYLNDFNSPSSDFVGNGFQIRSESGFSDDAIHSSHPYSNNQNITYTLTIPIIIAANNASVVYDDVAVVEPGEPGTVFGDPAFWDYVVIEGTRDGTNWIPLADGYDARYDPTWLNAYNSSTPGNSTMYVTHQVDLLNTFSPGEHILFRLRLYADGFVTGWGWALDNLKIQEGATGVAVNEDLPKSFTVFQNFPNPFNPSTTIRYQLPKRLRVELKIYNSLGQEVRSLVKEVQQAGEKSVVWDGRNEFGKAVASGIYLYRIKAADFVQSRKMILLR
jgi:FlgD Ig-like domain